METFNIEYINLKKTKKNKILFQQLEKDFNWNQYINNYKDLRDAEILTEKKAKEHWIYYGKKEGRTYIKLENSETIKISESKQQFGFIILRHVNNELTNRYWISCVNSIRQYYPENNILIIDDNSNYKYITEETLYKTTIINSEYHKRGELLPYYYYLHNKLFDVAIIIHDSVIVNKYIDFSVEKYKFLWEFKHGCDQIKDETKMINVFNNLELLKFYKNKKLWKGCFGCMTIITHNYLTYINNKYDISKLLDYVLNRYNRCSFERVIACLLQKEGKKQTLLGNIHKYCKWGIKFNQIDKYKNLPLIKHWTGR